MKTETIMELMERDEQSAQLSLALYGLLQTKGEESLAKMAWVIHLQVSQNAEACGEALGVEVQVA